MTQPDKDQAIMVASAAAVVARYLKTKHRTKKHGGYDIYEDEKIRVTLDTYVSNVDVLVNLNEQWTTVFAAGYSSWGHPQIFRPGVWVEHLVETLLPRAKEMKANQERVVAAQEAARSQERYGPIDDAAVFDNTDQRVEATVSALLPPRR